MPNEHGVLCESVYDIIRIGITNLRFALSAGAQLQEIAQPLSVAALSSNKGLDCSAMVVMRTGPDRGGENRTRRIVSVQALHQPQAPKGVRGRVRAINIFPLRRRQQCVLAAGGIIRIGKPGRAVPGDIDAPIVTRRDPGKDVVV